jgi:type IV secretory pathway VirB9-like protein
MRALAAILLASTSLAVLSQADAAVKKTAKTDSTIKVVAYSATRVTPVAGTIGEPTTFTFPQGENVERVEQTGLPGSKGAWQAAALGNNCDGKDPPKECSPGNNLTLWPGKVGESWMTVITVTANGQQKPYQFKLIANPAPDGPDAPDPPTDHGVIFRGGMAHADPPAGQPTTRAIKVRRQQQEIAENTLRSNSFSGVNPAVCHYQLKGKPHSPVEPLCPLDNGQWTAFRFRGLSAKPAIYILTGDQDCGYDDGKYEQLARQHGTGDYVVIEQIAAKFCLRLGENVLEVINTAYNPAGNPTGTGTTSPAVERDIIQAKGP